MSIQDYVTSQKIAAKVNTFGPGNEFYSLLMAAIRFADTDNLEQLEGAFPEIVIELRKRINAPGGALNHQEMEWVKRYLS
jgi:hypothetical protein